MVWVIIWFFSGVLLIQLCATLPNFWLISGVLIILFVGWRYFNRKWLRDLCKIFGIIALGFLWTLIRANNINSWHLPRAQEGKKVLIAGYIASLPDLKNFGRDDRAPTVGQNHLSRGGVFPPFPKYSARFIFDILSINGIKQKTKARLNWHGVQQALRVGDKWQLEVKLKRPHGVSNPGSFDFEKYLFQRGIRATGYVISDGTNALLASRKHHYFLDRARQLLREKVAQSLLNKPLTGIINTLIIGDQSGISKEQWQIFRNTGTSYLMAISGLHINFVAFLAFASANFLWRRLAHLCLRMPASQVAAVVSFMAAFIYSALSGFSIPTQRALIMLAVFTSNLILRRNIKSWDILIIALLLVLLIDPLAVLAEGFWLSFVAVGLILFVTKGRLKLPNSWVHNYWRIQWAITIGLVPFTLLLFNEASLLSLLASTIALPAVCSVIIPISLVGGLVLLINMHYGGYFLWLAEKIMQLVWIWLQWLSSFAWLNWQHQLFNCWVFMVAVIAIIWLLAPRGLPNKWLGMIWLLPLCFYKPAGPKYGEVWFTLLDVGQGLAAVVQTQKHIMLYDAGPTSLDSDAGVTVVVPFLHALGINNIDAMVISHGDDDHIGGAHSVLVAMPVKKIITSVPEQFAPMPASYCASGQSWNWDGVNFMMLNPKEKLFSGNNASCVLKITSGVNSILLVGDIERPAENWLINNQLANLAATILVAPHHGSKTSSSIKFVEAVSAKYVLLPIGYRNRFRFPSKIVQRRYTQAQAKLFDTAQFGAISFKLNNKDIAMNPLLYRITNRRYWNFVD